MVVSQVRPERSTVSQPVRNFDLVDLTEMAVGSLWMIQVRRHNKPDQVLGHLSPGPTKLGFEKVSTSGSSSALALVIAGRMQYTRTVPFRTRLEKIETCWRLVSD